LEYIMQGLAKILGEIRTARHLLILTDFDGTLAPIVERPELASLPENSRLLLKRLSGIRNVTVGVISGRALPDLKNVVNIEGLIYAGNHGFEIEGPELNFVNPIADEIRPIFRVVCRILGMALGSSKGVFVEDKGITLSVHYRQAEQTTAEEIRQIVESSLRGLCLSGLLRITSGKKVLELRPAVPWDKGKAIRLLMKRYGKGGRRSGLMPIYLGDDLTDEDAFKVIANYGRGVSIHVGEKPLESAADYYLKSTSEVPLFLSELVETNLGDVAYEPLSTSLVSVGY
jgi:trehalose 6-phosphate phosphatase